MWGQSGGAGEPEGRGPRGGFWCSFSFSKDQGAAKKNNQGPPWWVGGSEYEKGLGSDLFFRYFFIVFLNSPHRETPKNQKREKQNREKVCFGFLVELFVKTFPRDFFAKRFL
jgi:hypothetical protein